ncbi:MAG: hypothetical protein PF961_18575 [Planctomycetota bacterium]|jgi:hypothetical protein|nr:hypothetical protein [Planctomycetota bacterium]
MLRLSIALTVLLCAAGCSGRGAGTTTNPFVTYADTDFAATPDEVYAEAAQALSESIGRGLSALPGARGYGPRDVIAVLDGHLLAAVEPWQDAELLVLALSDGAGALRWSQDLPMASGSLITAVALEERNGAQLLRASLAEAGGIDALIVALTASGPVVVRAEAQGAAVNGAFRRLHPQVPTNPGKLGSSDAVQQLAATVYLAGPDQAEARGKAVVRGHLEALAGSTDTWLAQAAADLLTMPTR